MSVDIKRVRRELKELSFRCVVGGCAAFILATAACAVLVFISRSGRPASLAAASLVLFGLAVACFFAHRRYRRVGRGLALHGTATCPLCGRDTSGESRCCRRIPEGWSSSDIFAYWEDRQRDRAMALGLRRGSPPSSLTWWIERRVLVSSLLAAFSGLFLAAGLVVLAFVPRLLVGDAPTFALILISWPLMFAGVLWLHSRREYSRAGHCGACGHAMPPGEAPARCVECGKTISRGTIVYAFVPPNASWVFVLFFLPVLTFPLLNLWDTSGVGRKAFGVLPTSALVELAAAENGMNTAPWNELTTRQLTENEQQTLLELILNERASDSFFNETSDRGGWLRAVVEDDLLDADLLRQLRTESWIVDLVIPETPTAGVPFNPILSGERRAPFVSPSTGIAVLFDGFAIDDGPFLGAEHSSLWILHADRRDISRDGYRHFTRSITIPSPGTHRLRARYWLIDRPYGHLEKEVKRDEHDTPILPLRSTFMVPITIEETIEVAPATP